MLAVRGGRASCELGCSGVLGGRDVVEGILVCFGVKVLMMDRM